MRGNESEAAIANVRHRRRAGRARRKRAEAAAPRQSLARVQQHARAAEQHGARGERDREHTRRVARAQTRPRPTGRASTSDAEPSASGSAR